MAANPVFAATPKLVSVTTGLTANTALDGTGVLTTLLTAGTSGSRLDSVYLNHLGTNVATVVRFFVNGALVHEETMAANTVSQVASSIPVIWKPGLILPASAIVKMTIGTTVASGIMVTAEYGDF